MKIDIVSEWDHFLPRFPINNLDVYFSERYVKLYETSSHKAFCVVYEDNGFFMLMPFLRGNINDMYDFETPYGYGGPIFSQNDPIKSEIAIKSMINHLSVQNYLCGFVRFHPLIGNDVVCENIFKVIKDRYTVAVNTSGEAEQIWMGQMSTQNRSSIRKALSYGLRFVADYEFEMINEFISLYNKTMNRLAADDFYHFQQDYYDEFVEKMRGNAFLGLVCHKECIVSAALFMYKGEYGHYHLSGSNPDFLSYNPNNLLLFEASKELKRNGVSLFHLGGGADADPNNSLLSFKKRFGKELYQFSIGKIIFNSEIYNDICQNWVRNNPEKEVVYNQHLLKYRY